METKIVDTIKEASRLIGDRQSVCSIGVFDGVHVGHRKLLGDAIVEARTRDCAAVVFTFRNHPLSVLAPAYAPMMLTTIDEKLRRISELTPSVILAIEFGHDVANMEPEVFVRGILAEKIRSVSVWCGRDFRFGNEGRGDVGMLEQIGAGQGIDLHVIDPVRLHGHVVSSTLIRSLIEDGAMDRAAECLGRPFSVAGIVEPGDGRGAKLEYPTANIALPTGIVLPGDGIYLARVKTPAGDYDSILNLGPAPTFDITERRLEAHLLDFQGDLLGKKLSVEFVAHLRDIARFDSAEALVAQIREDERQARQILESLNNDR